MSDPHDNRVRCQDCQEWRASSGICMVAFRRDRLDVDRRYAPTVDLPIRCPFFLPVLTLPDQRHGIDRFPLLAREYRERFAGKRTAKGAR